MNLTESFELVARACTEYRGTLQEHQAIQTALKAVRDGLFPPEDVTEDGDGA